MKTLAVLVTSLLAAPALAQDAKAEGGFVPVGWSKKGHFGWWTFRETVSMERVCWFDAAVTDTATGKQVFHTSKNWVEDSDEEAAHHQRVVCPASAGAAWEAVKKPSQAGFKRFKVQQDTAGEARRFPLELGGDTFIARVFEVKGRFEVRVASAQHGEQTLWTGKLDGDNTGWKVVAGYVSPDGKRVAVHLYNDCLATFCGQSKVLGFTPGKGFTPPKPVP